MRILFFVVLSFIPFTTMAQCLKIDNGVTLSAFSNDKGLAILDTRIANYAISVGLDYLEKDWYSLSSQIGYLRVGGEQVVYNVSPEIGDIIEQKNYIHFNTTFRPRLDISNVSFFIGIGPTFDILADNKNAYNSFFQGYQYKDVRVGGKAEIGVIHEQERFRLGIVGGYLRNFSPTAETKFLTIYNHAFTAAITAGYRLK